MKEFYLVTAVTFFLFKKIDVPSFVVSSSSAFIPIMEFPLAFNLGLQTAAAYFSG